MNKFEKEQSMALMVGDDLSQPCHKISGKLRPAKSVKVRVETAQDLRTRLGFEPLTEEQKDRYLSNNLNWFCK